MKCTDNNLFRVRPALGFVEPGGSIAIKVSLEPRIDQFQTILLEKLCFIKFTDASYEEHLHIIYKEKSILRRKKETLGKFFEKEAKL